MSVDIILFGCQKYLAHSVGQGNITLLAIKPCTSTSVEIVFFCYRQPFEHGRHLRQYDLGIENTFVHNVGQDNITYVVVEDTLHIMSVTITLYCCQQYFAHHVGQDSGIPF